MVDFDTNAAVLGRLGITVVAASVDDVADSRALTENLRLGFVKMVAEIDGPEVASTTGAFVNRGDRQFLHATEFLLDPSGRIVNAVYSTGPIGRFSVGDVMKKTVFEQNRATD